VDDDAEDFHMYRRRVEEGLLNSCACLQASSLAILCELLASKGVQRWQAAEGVLFAMACIGGELAQLTERAQRESVQAAVTQLLSAYILPQSLPWHPLVQRQTLAVLEHYAKFIGQSEALVAPCLELALCQLPDKALADCAATALRQLCSRGAVHLRDAARVQSLLAALAHTFAHIPKHPRVVVVEALGRLLGGVQGEGQTMGLLSQLCTPFMASLKELTDKAAQGGFVKASVVAEAVHCLHLLGAAIRFLEAPPCSAGGHPVVGLLGSVWEGLEAARARFGADAEVVGALCGVYMKAIKQAREEAQPLLVPVVNAAAAAFRCSRAEACLECVAVAVEVFGKADGAAHSFGGLLGELAGVGLEALQERGVSRCNL
jgi:hypothetical protein